MSLVLVDRRQSYCIRRPARLQKGEGTRPNIVVLPTNQNSVFGFSSSFEPLRTDQELQFGLRDRGALGLLSGNIVGA